MKAAVPPGVELRSIEKRFGDVVAVAALDLTVAAGELLVLLGPSGCGKSTLLRIIAGLTDPTAGEVLIDGKPVNDVACGDRDVAMVFQGYALYPHMTVAKNLGFGLKVRGMAKEAVARRVGEVAEQLHLSELLERRPGQLSGGQQQRVALGRAMVRNPGVFLFDEPLSNLDARLRLRTRNEIAALHRRLRTTTIFVTHDQTEAMSLGQTVAVMKDGRLQQVGRPREVYETPANLFVAQFLGSPPINLVRLSAESPTAYARGPIQVPRQWPDAREITVGARAEDLRVVADEDDGCADFRAVVVRVESLGSENRVHVENPAGSGADWVVRTRPTVEVEVGQEVGIAVAWPRTHAFDERGLRLGPAPAPLRAVSPGMTAPAS